MPPFDILNAPLDAKREARASLENPTVPVSASNFLEFFGVTSGMSAAGVRVTTEVALGVPAIFAAVNFLSGTLAALPLGVWERTEAGRKKLDGSIAELFSDAVNDETTSYGWRKALFDQVFTEGRSYSWVEKDPKGEPVNIWLLEYAKVTPCRSQGRRYYEYREGGRVIRYEASEIIDISMMMRPDGLRHYSPIKLIKDVIGLAVAITRYGARFFNNGGVPPFTISGPIKTAAGVDKGSKVMNQAVKDAADSGSVALVLPDGHTLSPLGVDPGKMQMVEAQKFCLTQFARTWGLPPVFIQDLSGATFTNSEQQDLQLVKHVLTRWVVAFEQEVNLKVFGRGKRNRYVRAILDGLLRGDFLARMQAYAQAIQNAVLKPNEVRTLEEREAAEGGDDLLIQGATVPLKNQAKAKPPKAPDNAPKV